MKTVWQIVGWLALAAFIWWCFSSWADESFQDRITGLAIGLGILIFSFGSQVVDELKGLRRSLETLHTEMRNAKTASYFDDD